MSESYLDRIKPVIEMLKVDPYSFGYAGEMYLNYDSCRKAFFLFDRLLKKYLTRNDRYIYNRTSLYYSVKFHETINLLRDIPLDYKIILDSSINIETKRYLLFTMMEYSMAIIAKLLDLCFSYPEMKKELYLPLKTHLGDLSELLVDIACSDSIGEIPIFKTEFFIFLQKLSENHKTISVRQYVEMDHKMSLFIGYLLLMDYIDGYDLIVSPLLGGAFIPPLFVSLTTKTNPDSIKKTKKIDYVKCSFYDEGIKDAPPPDSFLEEQLKFFQECYCRDDKVLLIDDNIGSGRTINKLKHVLATHFEAVDTGGIEFFWERKLHIEKRNLPSFDINDFDFVSPLSYRYFRNLDQYIERLHQPGNLMTNKLFNHPMFFPDSVDGLINYREYLKLQDLHTEKKTMMANIYTRIRVIKHCFFMLRKNVK
jgi:hypothetical protein